MFSSVLPCMKIVNKYVDQRTLKRASSLPNAFIIHTDMEVYVQKSNIKNKSYIKISVMHKKMINDMTIVRKINSERFENF